MNSFNLNAYLTAKRSRINDELAKSLDPAADSTRIVSAMKYSLMAGGKRIRPILCMAATEAVGGDCDHVIPVACALEMIHTYSLIHDDLPAMDDDKLRRGRPTCHIAFDEATAILAGDALLSLAFKILSSIGFISESKALLWIKVMHQIATAVGYEGMIEGQMRDIASEGTLLPRDELEAMHALKTGALLETSVFAGAILGGGSHIQIERLGIYSKNIGLAFQVADDILNVEGDPAVMGKGVGTDQSRHKNTYPSLIGIDKSKALAEKLVNNALSSLDIFDNKADPLRYIASYIITRKR